MSHKEEQKERHLRAAQNQLEMAQADIIAVRAGLTPPSMYGGSYSGGGRTTKIAVFAVLALSGGATVLVSSESRAKARSFGQLVREIARNAGVEIGDQKFDWTTSKDARRVNESKEVVWFDDHYSPGDAPVTNVLGEDDFDEEFVRRMRAAQWTPPRREMKPGDHPHLHITSEDCPRSLCDGGVIVVKPLSKAVFGMRFSRVGIAPDVERTDEFQRWLDGEVMSRVANPLRDEECGNQAGTGPRLDVRTA